MKPPPTPMPLDAAIQWMRSQPAYADTVRDAYLGADVEESARRFAASGEFAAVRALLGDRLRGARVLDLGAGTGIASHAFRAAGAAKVFAAEPDPSALVGRAALERLGTDDSLVVLPDSAEKLSLADASVDLVYVRQVLHHLPDLPAALRECARVLRPGGVFLACREHVVDDAQQLEQFLAAHPVHQLAGTENAYSSDAYRGAIVAAGLQLQRELGPWDSVINAYPLAATEAELASYARRRLRESLGVAGGWLALVPGVEALAWRRLRRPRPGRLHTYIAVKPPS